LQLIIDAEAGSTDSEDEDDDAATSAESSSYTGISEVWKRTRRGNLTAESKTQ